LDIPGAEDLRIRQIGQRIELVAGTGGAGQPVRQIFVSPHERASIRRGLIQNRYFVAVAVARRIRNLNLVEVSAERALVAGLQIPLQRLEARLVALRPAVPAVAPLVPQLRLSELDL